MCILKSFLSSGQTMSRIKLIKPLWFLKPQMTFLIYLHNHAMHYPTQDLPYTISIWFFSLKLNPQYFCSKLGFRTKKKNKVDFCTGPGNLLGGLP